jgi:predicted component of type VI protein secretion system
MKIPDEVFTLSAIKRELIESINRLDVEKQRRVLEFVRSIEQSPLEKTLSPSELMKLPFEERNQLVAAALERSLNDDVELLEAYDEADFDDE